MLEKAVDEKAVIKAAKAFVKKYARIDEEPIKIIVDPWYVFLKFDERVSELSESFDHDNIEVMVGRGKHKKYADFEIKHENLSNWYSKFQSRS